jgi:hypothetical protein
MKDHREGNSAWSVVLGAVAAGLLGWYLGEGDFLVPLYKGAFDTLAFRLLMSGAVAVMFGGIFGFAFRSRRSVYRTPRARPFGPNLEVSR